MNINLNIFPDMAYPPCRAEFLGVFLEELIISKFASEIMRPLVQPYSILVVQNCNKSSISSFRYGFRPITIFTETSTKEFISPETCLGWLENPLNHGNLPDNIKTVGISNLRSSLLS